MIYKLYVYKIYNRDAPHSLLNCRPFDTYSQFLADLNCRQHKIDLDFLYNSIPENYESRLHSTSSYTLVGVIYSLYISLYLVTPPPPQKKKKKKKNKKKHTHTHAHLSCCFLGKYEAVHPHSSWVTSLGGLCKRNEGNLQRKAGRKKASCLLHYSFAPDKTFRFVLCMHKSIRKILLHSQELWGCSASHLPFFGGATSLDLFLQFVD